MSRPSDGFIKKNEYTRNVENHFNISDYSIKKQANKLEKIYYKLRDGDSNEC